MTAHPVFGRLEARVAELRRLRDVDGWPEPRGVFDLRHDPRAQLRNVIDGGSPSGDGENLELAAALILLVLTDTRSPHR